MKAAEGLGEEDLLGRAAMAVDELYEVRDSFFSADPEEKNSRIRSLADAALRILDAVPEEKRKSPSQRASFEYLRGKILDAFPDYMKEAEDHLSKAVKLNPSLGDAWLCLGNCIWKKGDLPSARNCFSLALSKGPNKNILCQLSMLERKLSQDSENPAEGVEESICLAKKAIALDVKDGNSWYCLGNACLTSFFVNGAWDYDRLLQSLKAYQNAEKDDRMKHSPDLYFNCATANKYLENYHRALTGFEAAGLRDPGLNASEQVRKIINVLDKVEISLKVQTKTKHTALPTSSFEETSMPPSQRKATIKTLAEGRNKTVALTGRVLQFLKHEDVPPLYYIVCDSEQTRFVLSVYGLRDNALKEGDWVTLLEPYHQAVDFSWKNKQYKFNSIRVDFVGQLLVNGKGPSVQHAVQSLIHAHHKP